MGTAVSLYRALPLQAATFILTSDYAYGAGGFPAWGIPPNASLTFEIELLSAK